MNDHKRGRMGDVKDTTILIAGGVMAVLLFAWCLEAVSAPGMQPTGPRPGWTEEE